MSNQQQQELVEAASWLAMACLRKGSPVEIYAVDHVSGKACFWSARITRRGIRGFWFAYEGSGERGYMRMKEDFLTRWRFPLFPASKHFTASAVQMLAMHAAS
jgi:hypothetical protein